jgi:hypothetical protein
LIDARRIAQIAIFVFGLSQLGGLIQLGTAFGIYLSPEAGSPRVLGLVVAATYTAFVLSLLFLSRGWASLVNVPGTVSTFRQLSRHELLQVGVALLALFFLITGVAGAVASVVEWFNAPLKAASGQRLPLGEFLNVAALLRGFAGAALLFWGTSVVNFIQWAKSLGTGRGAA